MPIKRICIAAFSALVLAFIVFNFENWLAAHNWNDLFTDFEKGVKEMEWSWAALWNAINAFMISDFTIGFVFGGLVFAFWDPLALYGTSLLKRIPSSLLAEAELVKQQRLAKKEDRVNREQSKNQKAKIAVAILDLGFNPIEHIYNLNKSKNIDHAELNSDDGIWSVQFSDPVDPLTLEARIAGSKNAVEIIDRSTRTAKFFLPKLSMEQLYDRTSTQIIFECLGN